MLPFLWTTIVCCPHTARQGSLLRYSHILTVGVGKGIIEQLGLVDVILVDVAKKGGGPPFPGTKDVADAAACHCKCCGPPGTECFQRVPAGIANAELAEKTANMGQGSGFCHCP